MKQKEKSCGKLLYIYQYIDLIVISKLKVKSFSFVTTNDNMVSLNCFSFKLFNWKTINEMTGKSQ